MALRQALRSLRPASFGAALGAAGMGTVALVQPEVMKVADKMIDITVVLEGVRYPIKGKIGHDLANVISRSAIPELEEACPVFVAVMGPDTHVALPPDIIAMLPELDDQQEKFLHAGPGC